MENKKAKLFICHHPGNLLLFRNLIQIIRKHDKNAKVLLFKINHPYFSKINFKPYQNYFDKVEEFEFIHYKKNFLKGILEVFDFQKKLKKVESDLLGNFEKIDLFMDESAYLPINLMLYNLSKKKNIGNITKFRLGGLEGMETKVDKLRTFLYTLYSLPFKCYKVKAISNLEGKFVNFIYGEKTPGKVVKIVSPITKLEKEFFKSENNILPYPVFSNRSSVSKKNMIIVFGKSKSFNNSPWYFPDYQTYLKKLESFFKFLENKYSDCKLYYKFFPLDGEKIMPGINIKKYAFLDSTSDAQELIYENRDKIKAIYTPFSGVATYGSFLGIPSYTFYRYLCNQSGIERFDSLMDGEALKSKFLFHLSDPEQIGKIDNLKRKIVNFKKLEKIYKKILYV
jgi:hypothetical protein